MLFLSPAMSLPSFVQLMALLCLQDPPPTPMWDTTAPFLILLQHFNLNCTCLVPLVLCANCHLSPARHLKSCNCQPADLNYLNSSQGSSRSSNAAPSPAIIISAANASPISHHHNWDTDHKCEWALCNTKKATCYAPDKTESCDVHFPNHSICFPCGAVLIPIFLFSSRFYAQRLSPWDGQYSLW